jgi:uncharacterized protein Usg
MRANHNQEDYRLTTAEIFYHSAGSPQLVQSLTWQDYDLAPDFPELRKFLTYWARHIDAIVQSVQVAEDEQPMRKHDDGYAMPSTVVH